MGRTSAAIAVLLLATVKSAAQQVPELLQDVEPSRARLLQEYNSVGDLR